MRKSKRTFQIENILALVPIVQKEKMVIELAMIPTDALPYFESAIYLSMLISIFESNHLIIKESPIKLNRPYLKLIEKSIEIVKIELKETNIYLKKNSMKLIKGENDLVYVCGGVANDILPFIQLHYPKAQLVQPLFQKLDGVVVVGPVFVNAIGNYELAKLAYTRLIKNATSVM